MFRHTLVVRALAIAFGTAALAIGVGPAAYAQSNATGNIFGQVDSAPGTTISIENRDTGAKRSLTPDEAGRFQATSLATGQYRVQLIRGGQPVGTRDIEVVVGQGAEVNFTATALQSVQVVGQRQVIDISSVGSTTTFTASDLARIPIANNVGAVIQLAPNTTRGDSRYGGGNAPSFGGSSASENAYYINGFPVTTLLTQVGFAQLPFNSIAQAQILTGGYGAEFGRSTGGVVNIITKSGSNSWVLGGAVSVEPKSLRSKEKNQLYENNGTTLDGTFRFYNGLNTDERTIGSFYAGGPLIKDKLFIFVAAEHSRRERESIRIANTSATYAASAAAQATQFQERTVEIPRYLGKIDWNITDQHHLEYTKIHDRVKDTRNFFGFNYATLERTNVQAGGQTYVNWGPAPTPAAQQGAEVDILKYTGNFTENLTFTALLGRTRTPHNQIPAGFDPTLAQVISASGDEIAAFRPYNHPQGVTGNLLVPGAFDENKGARLDVEYKLNSKHTLRAGIDRNTIKSLAGSATAGGVIWRYGTTNPAVKLDAQTVAINTLPVNAYATVPAGQPNAGNAYYVERIVSASSSTPEVDQSAWYIEDKYQVTDRLLLSLGLRNEGFNNKNGDGESYIKLSRQLAPRFGAVWDVAGDSSFKVFGNLGRYHVPLPTNVAVRGAGSSLNAQQNFVYTGVDANGAPTGVTSISPFYSQNNELGQAKDPRQVAAQNMKGNYQDEFALGMEKALSKDLTVGAKLTYRSLRTAIDDHCDDRPFRAWSLRNNVDDSDWHYNCALFNPGIGNTFTIDINGDGVLENINLSAADLGFPKVKRKYVALDLFAERPFDGKWWTKVTYTWSRNTGNMEGQLLSDIGQADVSTSQAFDFPEFSVNSLGRLPNDRTHQLKAFGYYQVTPQWGLGANFLLASGRPKNCIGNAPDPVPANLDPAAPFAPPVVTNYSGYGSAYFFCNGVASPRGSGGNLPADMRLDLNAVYKPAALPGFAVKLDIFNAFNRQSIETIEERFNTPGGASSVWTRYATVESYTTPRSVKITASYDYKF